jgi:hypothetical protein
MKVLIAYLLLLLIMSASIHTCTANDEYDDWEEEEDSFVFETPVRKEVAFIAPSEPEYQEQKLIVTICDYDFLGNYSCKDLP